MNERTRKCLLGTSLLVILICALSVVLLVVASLLLDEQTCKLLAEKPQLNDSKLESIASDNNLALAKFAGYLKFEPGEVVGTKEPTNLYMPLKLESVEYEEDKSNNLRLLGLSSDCSNIRLSLTADRWNLSVQAALLELPDLEGQRTEADEAEATCFLENLAGVRFAERSEHYACSQSRSYPCILLDSMGRGRLVATLTVSELAFELAGDPLAHKAGNYTKSPNYCPASS